MVIAVEEVGKCGGAFELAGLEAGVGPFFEHSSFTLGQAQLVSPTCIPTSAIARSQPVYIGNVL